MATLDGDLIHLRFSELHQKLDVPRVSTRPPTLEYCAEAFKEMKQLTSDHEYDTRHALKLQVTLENLQAGGLVTGYRIWDEINYPGLLLRSPLTQVPGTYRENWVVEALIMPTEQGGALVSAHRRAIGQYTEDLRAKFQHRIDCWLRRCKASTPNRATAFRQLRR